MGPCLLVLLLVGGCSGSDPRVAWEGDGAPVASLRAEQVADAIPRPDPLLPAGNGSPYRVNGVEYQVLPTASGYRAEGIASWYGTKFHGNRTANGEVYDLYLPTAAHRTLPIPSYLRVTNRGNGRSIVVRVNDRGPFHAGRIIDLSYAAAVRLGFAETGTAPVLLEAVEVAGVDDRRDRPEGHYRYLQLGAFANHESAHSLRDSVEALVGAPVTVSPVEIGGKRLNRVRLGPVDSAEELLRVQRLLQQRGYPVAQALP